MFQRLATVLFFCGAIAFGDSEECLECHSDPDFAKDGTPQVDRAAFAAGVHAKLQCTECHKGDQEAFDAVPHELGDEVLPRCIRCHGVDLKEAKDEFKRGVHPMRMPDTFSCDACHDPHAMPRERPALGTPERTELANQSCLRCHRDADFRIAAKHGDRVAPPKSTHDWLPNLGKHARVRCVVCHTLVEGKQDHEILPK